jgi:anti-sigma factor RsiW
VCHRTVSGAPGPYDSELATFEFQKRRSAIINRTVRCTSAATANQRNDRLQRSPASYSARTIHAEVRAAARRRTGQYTVPVWCGTRLSGATRTQSSNGRNRHNPNGWVTWLAHRTLSGGAPDCPVRPSTAACPNG